MSKNVKKKGDDKRAQVLENQLKRALADYSNLQRRVEQEKEQIVDFVKASVLTRFFNVLDILEAAENSEVKNDPESIKQGVRLALKEFKNALSNSGVEEIEVGNDFDPQVHEAVEVVDGKADNKIAGVIARGYKIGDRVLRAAKVKVSKKGINSK